MSLSFSIDLTILKSNKIFWKLSITKVSEDSYFCKIDNSKKEDSVEKCLEEIKTYDYKKDCPNL